MNRILIGLVATIAALFSLGCDRQPDAPAPPGAATPMKLILNWKPEPEFGGFFAARDLGPYKKAGLDVTIESSPEHVTQLLAAGQADFGILAADEVLTARAQGIDLIALFAVYQTNPQGIMTHASRGFTTLADVMKSPGTVAVQPGLPYVDFLKRKYAPLAAKIVPYDYSITRFMADADFSQQCFITSEPFTAKSQGADPKVFLIAEAGFNPYAGLVVARGQTWREHPERVKAFIDATRAGWRAYLDDPTAVNTIMAELNKEMSPAAFAAAADAQKPLIETDFTRAHRLGDTEIERWKTLADQMVDLALLKTAPPPEACFANP